MTQVRSIALGGGIAGLSAAYRAKSLGHRLPVYEASATPGGLLDSFQLENETGIWTFDNGVHLSFATEKEVREVFDRVPYLSHEARSLNWDSIRWLPHPVQNNMFALPVNEKVDLIADLAAHLEAALVGVELFEGRHFAFRVAKSEHLCVKILAPFWCRFDDMEN